ncbi:MAG: histidine kinase [Ginsengibacter sp.]
MAASILSDKKLRYFFTAWWLIWIVLQYYVLRQSGIDQRHSLADSGVGVSLLALSSILLNSNMKYYLPRDKYGYIFSISAIITIIWWIIFQGILFLFFGKNDIYFDFIVGTSAIRFGAAFLLLSSMSMFSMLWYSRQEQKETNERHTESEKLIREAELNNLRQQLQPHFLFNSLNSISALIISDPEKARNMIFQLSDFLRGTLKKETHQWISLKEEFEYLRLYLEIEKVRFGNRLQADLIFSDEILSYQIPVLLLQPVVENAIKFGLYDTIEDVLITIEAVSEKGYLKIIIKNPFDPETSIPLKGTGFGLASVKRRLFLLFARADLVETSAEEQIFITKIKIPQPA